MLFFRKLVFLALSIGIFSFENAADAGVIYNNLPPVTSIGGTDPIAVDGPSYNSFSTGSSVAVLTDVKMLLQRSLALIVQVDCCGRCCRYMYGRGNCLGVRCRNCVGNLWL